MSLRIIEGGRRKTPIEAARAVQRRLDAALAQEPVPQPDIVREMSVDALTSSERVALFGCEFADTEPADVKSTLEAVR